MTAPEPRVPKVGESSEQTIVADAELRLLLVEDNVLHQAAVRHQLGRLLPKSRLQVMGQAEGVLSLVQEQHFDCVLVDHHLPQASGPDLIRELQGWGETAPPVIMLTGAGDERIAVEALKAGAADYIPKGTEDASQIARAIMVAVRAKALEREVREYRLRLERQALTDELTGAGNRAAYRQHVQRLFAGFKRQGPGFGMALLDLDQFKPVNDQYGHLSGDAVLVETVRRIQSVVRETDVIFRLGGDEFAVVLSGIPAQADWEALSARMMEVIQQPLRLESGEEIICRGSVGYARVPEDVQEPEALFRLADERMYAVKGRARAARR